MFHLIKGGPILKFPEPIEARTFEETGMDKVLVNGRKLLGQYSVQRLNYTDVTLHSLQYPSFPPFLTSSDGGGHNGAMLDMAFIKRETSRVKEAIEAKGIDLDLDYFLALHKKLNTLKGQMDTLRASRNEGARKMKGASPEESKALVEEGRRIKGKMEALGPELEKVEAEFRGLSHLIPAMPSPSAPVGRDAGDNVELRRGGRMPNFSFEPLDHMTILAKNDWAEFERTAEVCGSRSYALKNEMLFLEMGIHRLALHILRAKKMELLTIPSLVRRKALVGTGHFPTGEDQVYRLEENDVYLSGTAEVQLNSLHAGEVLREQDLPLLYAGHAPCFRREAGSYGKDVRGLVRVHQFLKTEMYIICRNDPAESERWHQWLLDTSLEIVDALELPYRVVECCTGDMGPGKVRMYDVECWIPSEGAYRETHSCSALGDWQARRTNLRYRGLDGKIHYAHTLNNTAVATPRIMVSLLECHQQEDGRLNLPVALRAQMGGETILGREKNGKE